MPLIDIAMDILATNRDLLFHKHSFALHLLDKKLNTKGTD